MTKLCDYYVINGPVDDTMESGAKNAVSKSDGGEECAIFLTTYGGSADVAYRVMRLFQRRYKNIKIIVTGKCKSAGTIMAIGANTLVPSLDLSMFRFTMASNRLRTLVWTLILH